MSTTEAAAPPPPTLPMGLLTTALVIVGVVSWVVVGYYLLHLTSFFATFLLLWYWATVEKADLKRMPSAMIGALVGLALAWIYQQASARFGIPGMSAALVLIVVAILAQVMNWAPIAVNAACMLFLTVGCIPVLQAKANFLEVGAAVVAGGAFFAALIWLGGRFAARKSEAVPAHTATAA